MQSISTYVEGIEPAPCVDEMMAYQGTVNFLIHSVATGSNVTFTLHSNNQNFSATGLTTGSKYRIIEIQNISIQAKLPVTVDQSFTAISNIKLVSGSNAPDLSIKATLHLTVNASLQVTASVEKFSFGCN